MPLPRLWNISLQPAPGGFFAIILKTAVEQQRNQETKAGLQQKFQVLPDVKPVTRQVKIFAPPISGFQPVFVALFLGCSFSNC
jgi:hypothetical protein